MISDIFPIVASRLSDGVISRGEPPGVYLTFDDGPHPQHTPKFLDILTKYDCKATFFVTGRLAEKHPDIVRMTAEAGHTIGSHGYNHSIMILKKERVIHDNLKRSLDTIADITGSSPRLFRPPHGWFGRHLRSVATELGLKLVLWSLSPADYVANPPTVLERRIVRRIRPGDIVLLHDGAKYADNLLMALPRVLEFISTTGLNAMALKDE